MTTTTEATSASSSGTTVRRMSGIAAMLWAERALVLGLGGVICVLGLVAALAAPQAYAARTDLMIVTLLTASVVAVGAGLSRAAKGNPIKQAKAPPQARKGKPRLVLVQGGA